MPRERRKCNVPKCTKWAHAQGLCNQHYLQRMRNPETGFVHSENGLSREKRLENLLSLCDGFLHTVITLNDRVNAQTRAVRSPEAQRLYELALELRVSIARELPGTSKEQLGASDWLSSYKSDENGRRVGAKREDD